jgi:hypothetical protein
MTGRDKVGMFTARLSFSVSAQVHSTMQLSGNRDGLNGKPISGAAVAIQNRAIGLKSSTASKSFGNDDAPHLPTLGPLSPPDSWQLENTRLRNSIPVCKSLVLLCHKDMIL